MFVTDRSLRGEWWIRIHQTPLGECECISGLYGDFRRFVDVPSQLCILPRKDYYQFADARKMEAFKSPKHGVEPRILCALLDKANHYIRPTLLQTVMNNFLPFSTYELTWPYKQFRKTPLTYTIWAGDSIVVSDVVDQEAKALVQFPPQRSLPISSVKGCPVYSHIAIVFIAVTVYSCEDTFAQLSSKLQEELA